MATDFSNSRGRFTTSFGFVMAATGSAVGLGNIWGFPTLAAQNGGAAFLLVYLLIAFLVGFPLLIAEFTLGRHARSNPVGTYQKIPGGKPFVPVGFAGIVTVSLVLSFYCVVSGKMLAFLSNAVLNILGLDLLAAMATNGTIASNLIFTTLFFLSTLWIILAGVQNGIEKWSVRLMPSLILVMILLIVYVLNQEGSYQGLMVYLIPDFNKILNPRLLLDAMGQSFFSLSLAVGGMLVFASYTSKQTNLLRMGAWVTLSDIVVAFLAGLLIIPAMYVAQANGTVIFNPQGELISGPYLIFQVLPELFNSLGELGTLAALVFFVLMALAALTSSIGMMEVPTSYLIDNWGTSRSKAAYLVGGTFWIISLLIVFNEEFLLQAIIAITTKYSQPLLGVAICVFTGWIVNRTLLLTELSQGNSSLTSSGYFGIWIFFLRYICPVVILLVFLRSLVV